MLLGCRGHGAHCPPGPHASLTGVHSYGALEATRSQLTCSGVEDRGQLFRVYTSLKVWLETSPWSQPSLGHTAHPVVGGGQGSLPSPGHCWRQACELTPDPRPPLEAESEADALRVSGAMGEPGAAGGASWAGWLWWRQCARVWLGGRSSAPSLDAGMTTSPCCVSCCRWGSRPWPSVCSRSCTVRSLRLPGGWAGGSRCRAGVLGPGPVCIRGQGGRATPGQPPPLLPAQASEPKPKTGRQVGPTCVWICPQKQ